MEYNFYVDVRIHIDFGTSFSYYFWEGAVFFYFDSLFLSNINSDQSGCVLLIFLLR